MNGSNTRYQKDAIEELGLSFDEHTDHLIDEDIEDVDFGDPKTAPEMIKKISDEKRKREEEQAREKEKSFPEMGSW